MAELWEFQSVVWQENGPPIERTIDGARFKALMDLCFDRADCFSMTAGPWTRATDTRLQEALRPFWVTTLHTNRWFCYRSPQSPLEVNLYRATDAAKHAVLRYARHLFLWGDDETELCSLEDLCFFKDGALFLGTVTHERMCYAHVDAPAFGTRLRALGTWRENADNALAFVSLKEYAWK